MASAQINEYEEKTLKYKQMREAFSKQDSAPRVMFKKRDYMNHVKSKLPELCGLGSET